MEMNKQVFVFGKSVIEYLAQVGSGVRMIALAFGFLPSLRRSRPEVYRQMMLCGVRSFGVTSVVALFTGMILSLQAGLILKTYGQEMRVGFLVAQTMFREMGPFMTALILAASVGSGMAALIGTMKVSQELAALEVMSIHPVRFLVAPRLFAMMVMCPVLTMYTDLIGILGGGLVASVEHLVRVAGKGVRVLPGQKVVAGVHPHMVAGGFQFAEQAALLPVQHIPHGTVAVHMGVLPGEEAAPAGHTDRVLAIGMPVAGRLSGRQRVQKGGLGGGVFSQMGQGVRPHLVRVKNNNIRSVH